MTISETWPVQSRLFHRLGIQGGFEMPRLILYSGSPFFERSCLTFKCCRRTTAATSG
jgi:hypothetical protein